MKVLVTGATGSIGRELISDLLSRGHFVRATAGASPAQFDDFGGALEWRPFDFLADTDYDTLVAGCDAIFHVDADMATIANMQRYNVDATRLLAEAAEAHGVKVFCYKSSIAVYGSGLKRVIAEDAPVLTPDRDVPSEYWAVDETRAYARTKLAGELAIRKVARNVRYVFLRSAVAVGLDEIIDIRNWSKVKRSLAAHRHAHHIYLGDVSDIFIWAMERALSGTGAPGSVETFNMAEDEFAEPTHAAFLRKAYAATGDSRFNVVQVPWIADWLHDFLRFRRLPLRNPLWNMRFPNDRLLAAGYRFRYGMAHAHAAAIEKLKREAKGAT